LIQTKPLQPVKSTLKSQPPTPHSSNPRVLRKIFSLDDLEKYAEQVIPRPIFGYVASGSDRSASIEANTQAFNDLAFLPKILIDTSNRHQKTTLFGNTYDTPFGIAPMGGTTLAAYQGDLLLARGAKQANIAMILSGASLTPLETIHQACPHAWFQAYLPGDPLAIENLLSRVTQAGYETLVLTVDVPVDSNLELGIRSGFKKPFTPNFRLAWDFATRPRWLFTMLLRTLIFHGMPHVENLSTPRTPIIAFSKSHERTKPDQLAWEHLALIRRLWKGNLVVKGVLNPEDARTLCDYGADGIIVSNHGGRQLDHVISPLRALPGIVAKAGHMTVMLDSSVRRGTEVLKALGMGAKFVFIGRPFLYGAAIGAQAGVNHVVQLLRDEIDRDMALLGINSVSEMTSERLIEAHRFIALAKAGDSLR